MPPHAVIIAGRIFIISLGVLFVIGLVQGAIDGVEQLRDTMLNHGWFWRWL